MHNLLHRLKNTIGDAVLIRISTSYDGVNGIKINLYTTISRTIWQFTYICFVRSWNMEQYYMVAWLLQIMVIKLFGLKPNSVGKFLNHSISHAVCVITRYFALAEDQNTISCFLFHITRLSPAKKASSCHFYLLYIQHLKWQIYEHVRISYRITIFQESSKYTLELSEQLSGEYPLVYIWIDSVIQQQRKFQAW